MYTEFEQNLILACKNWYGDNGIEKVIRDYIGYIENQRITLDSKYHFISELFTKLCNNNHLRINCLMEKLSPRYIYDPENRFNAFNPCHYNLYDIPRIICNHMISEIQGLKTNDGDKVIVELHEPNEKFKR